MKAVVPGSFDPVTNGHVNIISRAATMFDAVVVAVGVNSTKNYLFNSTERLDLAAQALAGLSNVTVVPLDGLLVDLCQEQQAKVIVKGIRGAGDVDFELSMARMNFALAQIETVLLPAAVEWGHVSSTLVRQVAGLGGDVAPFVPKVVLERLRKGGDHGRS